MSASGRVFILAQMGYSIFAQMGCKLSLLCPFYFALLSCLSPKNRYDFKFRYIFLRYVSVIVFKQCSPSLDDVPHL
jgi:hypothetical protein